MDKREAVRVPVRVRARCRASGMVLEGLVEDVSRSGLFLRATGAVRPGTHAEIDLDLPDDGVLHMEARVVRVDETGLGLRFDEEAERNRVLANFIMRQHATAR